MSRDMPWYKREPAAFFKDTVGWRGVAKCAYSLLLDLIYMHGGKVADDAAYISAQLGHTKTMWTRTIRTELLERGVIEIVDGYVTNPRATREINDVKNPTKSQQTRKKLAKSQGKNLIKTTVKNTQDRDIDITPNPLQGNCDFYEFFEVYPIASRHDPDKAEKHWRDLDSQSRQAAKDGIVGLAADAKTSGRKPPTPATYLRGKHWLKYPVKPQAEKPSEGTPARVLFDALVSEHTPQAYHNFFADASIDGNLIRMSASRFERAKRYRSAVRSAGFKMELVA